LCNKILGKKIRHRRKISQKEYSGLRPEKLDTGEKFPKKIFRLAPGKIRYRRKIIG
jgi:hypothetical protein